MHAIVRASEDFPFPARPAMRPRPEYVEAANRPAHYSPLRNTPFSYSSSISSSE